MMTFSSYAEMRLDLEARLRETYEEEFREQAALDHEREELVARLRENFKKFSELHLGKEKTRHGLKDAIAKLERKYDRGEVFA